MVAPVSVSYVADSGQTIYGGRRYSGVFDSVAIDQDLGGAPDSSDDGKILVVELHGSGGQPLTNGLQYLAQVSGRLAHDTYTTFRFSTAKSVTPNIVLLRDVDLRGNYPGNAALRESMHLGFQWVSGGDVYFIHKHCLEAMVNWATTNMANLNHQKACLRGGSMGGWGTMHWGIRRPDLFAAIYPDRPRWRYDNTVGNIPVPEYWGVLNSVPVASSPMVSKEDGGGTFADYFNSIAYILNTANKIPWMGWNVGWQDGFTQRSDHVAAVAAMRAAKRGFAFAWNNGNHPGGSIPDEITQSYPYGTFEIGKGYPLFTNHSADNDPAVDLVGGINIGLSFRNVVESATGWSCEVTSVLGARTVDVEPKSEVFTNSVIAQTVTIPAANSWVAVSF